MNALAQDPDIEAALAAREAFERSDHYEWCGEEIAWSNRHDWLWIAILRRGEYVHEQAALAAMWLGQIIEIDDVRATERRWRKDPESVLDALAEFFARFRNDSTETKEALEVARQIQEDIDASTDEPAGSEGGDGEPKKSQAQPDTSTTFTPLPGLAQTPLGINSPTPKGYNSTASSSTPAATSS